MKQNRPDTQSDQRASLRRAVRLRLLPWFDRHRRKLPWRANRTPYRVWIAELMLQQTRVDQAEPYYRRFMKQFPSLKRLADATQQEVLKQWEGLGYYSRARNLHQAARLLVRDHKGRFPEDYERLKSLPGIGAYTAAAIASLAFNKDYAVLDGNVIRVLARLLGYPGESQHPRSRRDLQAWADALLVQGHAARYNEAMMELGAMICTPRNPRCGECPMNGVCVARKEGRPEQYPRKRPRAKVPHKIVGAAVVVNRKGEVLIAQRLDNSMLGGLWEFPGGTLEDNETMPECVKRELKEELGIAVDVGDRLMIVRHAYSHFTIALHVYMARIRKGRPRPIHCADYRWTTLARLRDFPFSRADLHIVERLEQHPFPTTACPPRPTRSGGRRGKMGK